MRKFSLSLGVAAMLIGGAAYAQPAHHAGGDITRAQAQQMAEQAFGRMDANNDGVIDQADREARQKARFDQLDTDRNGSISYAEFSAMHDRQKNRRAHAGKHGENSHEGRRRGGMGPMAMHGMKPDQNGPATRAEFVASALQHFDRADTDRNGTVTAQERQAAHEAMRAQVRQQHTTTEQ